MAFNSIGDLANSMMLSRSSAQAKRALAKLSTELTTGFVSDTRAAVNGDFSALSDWEQSIQSAQRREKTLGEAFARVQAKRTVLDSVSHAVGSLANDLDFDQTSQQQTSLTFAAMSAKGVFDQIIGQLNTTVAGRSVFGGAATLTSAMGSADAIYASAKAAISGAATVMEISSRLQTWMDDPVGGYGGHAYLGSTDDGPPVRVSSAHTIDLPGRADDPAVKSAVQGLLLAAFAGEADFGLPPGAQRAVFNRAADVLREAEGHLIMIETAVGDAEAQIGQAKTKASSEISAAQQLKLSALGADPYDTASRLQNTELQLQKIYMLTARSAQMSLAEYL